MLVFLRDTARRRITYHLLRAGAAGGAGTFRRRQMSRSGPRRVERRLRRLPNTGANAMFQGHKVPMHEVRAHDDFKSRREPGILSRAGFSRPPQSLSRLTRWASAITQ